jgi:uncharacterized repeat protein (TIGR01451 family)
MSRSNRVRSVLRVFIIQAIATALLLGATAAGAYGPGSRLIGSTAALLGWQIASPGEATLPVAPRGVPARQDDLAPSATFVPGDLVVYRPDAGGANNTTFSIVEVNPTTPGQTGTGVQTIAINGTTAPNAMRTSGSATSTGYLATTNDGTLLTWAAHNSTTTSGNANAILPRGVGSLNNAGTFALQTTYTGGSGDQARGATSLNNANWFIADQGGLHTNGSSSPSPNNNLRSIKSFGGAVYTLQQSSTATTIVVSSVSAPSGATIAGLPGLTNNNTAQDFYLISSGNNGAAFDVLYVSNNSSATAGTIQKFSLVSGSWTANGSYTTTFGGFGIAAAGSGAGAVLYVTSGNGATVANNVIKLTDTAGYNSPISITTASNVTLFTSPAGTNLKGIAFAPLAAPLSDLTTGISGPATGTVGVPYSYTVRASNSGAANATGVKLSFALPAGVTFNSANGTNGFACSESGGVVTCTGGTLNANTGATINVSVTPTGAGTVNVPTGSAVVDPDLTIAESNDSNNSSNRAVSTSIGGAANTNPTIVAAGTTTAFLGAPPAGPAAVSGVINDPTDPAGGLGIDFTIGDAETAAGSLGFTTSSSNPAVVPNNPANLVVSGAGANRNVKIVPAGVGYSTITITVTDAGSLTATYTINYAASAGSGTPASTVWHTGVSDGSASVAVDANYMFVADDENQGLRLYNRAASGLPVYVLDVTPSLGFTDLGHPEADLEGAAQVGNRIYWLASQDNSSSGAIRPNRYRFFATDVTGTGAAATLSYVGRYDGLRTDLLNWDSSNAHGLGANHYGLVASAASGVLPEEPDGSGFNIEGFVMAPGSTTTGYISFRAPISPAASRTKALIVPVTNVPSLVTANPSAGPATFGAPIELDLGGRGIRDIAKNSNDQYLIVAGPASETGTFALYTWSGIPTDAPVLRSANLSGLNPEGIAEVSVGLSASSVVQLITDGGDTVLYGDGIIAKELSQPNFKKFRSDLVTLGPGDLVVNNTGSIAPDTYHDITINNCGTTATLTGNIVVTGTLTINNCGNLNTNGFVVSGTGAFALNAGGWLHITDPNGISTGTTMSGSIQVSGGRSYSAAANYDYNGGVDQSTGNGLPATVNALSITNPGNVALVGPVLVPNTLTLSAGRLVTGANVITVGTAGTLVRTAGFVDGNLQKQFGGPGAFTFAVGTQPNDYTPVNTTVTAGSGNLTIKANAGQPPIVAAGHSIQRFWTLNGSGITTNLVFNYLDGDVMGNEASYRIIRISGGTAISFVNNCGAGSPCVNTAANTATINGVQNFSDWTVGENLAPTAAPADLSGHIYASPGGRGLRSVAVTLRNLSTGEARVTRTDARGRYVFTGLNTGVEYVVSPSRAGYEFTPAALLVNLTGALGNVDFIGGTPPSKSSPKATAPVGAIQNRKR